MVMKLGSECNLGLTPVVFMTFKMTFKFKIERDIHRCYFFIQWVTDLAWMPAINKQC